MKFLFKMQDREYVIYADSEAQARERFEAWPGKPVGEAPVTVSDVTDVKLKTNMTDNRSVFG